MVRSVRSRHRRTYGVILQDPIPTRDGIASDHTYNVEAATPRDAIKAAKHEWRKDPIHKVKRHPMDKSYAEPDVIAVIKSETHSTMGVYHGDERTDWGHY